MDVGRKRTLIVVLIAVVIAGSAVTAYLLSGPPSASAPEEAIRAAADIREQMGGGRQPTDANGVPRDAVPDPNVTPGRMEVKPKGG